MSKERWPNGRYEGNQGEVPIVVTDGGHLAQYNAQGPWVRYRMIFDPDTAAVAVLEPTFAALVEVAGYKHVPGGALS